MHVRAVRRHDRHNHRVCAQTDGAGGFLAALVAFLRAGENCLRCREAEFLSEHRAMSPVGSLP